MYNHARLICDNGKLKSAKVKTNKRFHFYDQLLLIILTLWPKMENLFLKDCSV